MDSTPTPISPNRRRYVWQIVAGVIVFDLVVVAVLLGYLKHRRALNNWGVVEAGRIYRSGQLSDLALRDQVQRNHIGVIISLATDSGEGVAAQAECKIAQDLGVQRWNLPLNGDGIGDPARYADAIKKIVEADRQGKVVLVHCHAGAQRTGGIIAVYRVLVERQSPQTAYAEMLRYGYDPKKNAALIDFLNKNMAAWAASLVQMKVIDAVPDPLPRFTP